MKNRNKKMKTFDVKKQYARQLAAVRAALAAYDAGTPGARVICVSDPNEKTCAVRSFSLSPLITCGDACRGTCDLHCYAVGICNYSPSALRAYARNTAAVMRDMPRVFDALEADIRMHGDAFFRWFVSGDILNSAFFAGMVQLAERLPNVRFLAYTKRYAIVNDWIDAHGDLPANLQVLFSGWYGLTPDNPHNLPESMVYAGTPENSWIVCEGNCAACCMRGCGCWNLRRGETVYFHEH